MMGAAVQAASSCSTSSVGSLCVTVAVMAVVAKSKMTNDIRKVRRRTWSCKNTTSSIVGPVASCSDSWVAYGTGSHRFSCYLAMTELCNVFTRFSRGKH